MKLKVDVKSSRPMKLAESKLMAAVESKAGIEATVALKTNVGSQLCKDQDCVKRMRGKSG